MKPQAKTHATLHNLLDVGFRVRADFGTVKMTLQEILDLQQRGLVELERAPDGCVDVYIDEQKIARGEVLAMNNHYAVRITEMIPAKVLSAPRHTAVHTTGEVHAPSFAELMQEAESDAVIFTAPPGRESSIADGYDFPDDASDGAREGRRDDPVSGPVDRHSPTYSPRRSVPNVHRSSDESEASRG